MASNLAATHAATLLKLADLYAGKPGEALRQLANGDIQTLIKTLKVPIIVHSTV